MTPTRLVTSAAEAKANIDRYQEELAVSESLQDVMSYARAWHGYRASHGTWQVAPSKFIGYAGNDAAAYAAEHQERDGRRTERALASWSEPVAPGTAIHEDIFAAVMHLFARYGRTPNKRLHISALKVERDLSPQPAAKQPRDGLASRITVAPDVCGGRPTIRGMRIRVSDILDMLAGGATRKEVLSDFPYLEGEDIDAALRYAAEAIDHRVISAA